MMLARLLLLLLLAAAPALAQEGGGVAPASALTAAPHVATNALLAAAANSAYPTGVWRDHYATGGFADGPLFFSPQTGTCAANSWVNDGGNCVDSTSGDGNSWKALHQDNVLNVREFGAKGDNSTDDTAAIQAAINAAQSATPGIRYAWVVFPSGNYCIATAGGLTVTAVRVILWGQGVVNVNICGTTDSNLLSMNGAREKLIGIALAGYNSPTVTTGHNALTIGSSCVECIIESPTINGGYVAISNAASDVLIRYTKALSAYGPAVAQTTGAGYWIRNKFDQPWPTNTAPTAPVTLAAWAATHSYATSNEIVSIGSNAWILQKTSGSCTSGSVEPAVAAYGASISDGTCTWQLAQPYAYDSMRVDTGGGPVYIDKLDATGDFTHGVGIGEDGGAGPQQVTLRDVNVNQALSAGIYAQKGQGLFIETGSSVNCVLAGCKGVQITSTFGQNVHIGAGFLSYTNPIDVSLEGGTGLLVDGASLHGSSTACVSVAAGVSNWTVANSDMTTGSIWGACTATVTVATGASDHYNIVNNLTSGTAPVDNGTGTHKTITGNN